MTRNGNSMPLLNARVHKIETARSVPSKENAQRGKIPFFKEK